MITHRTFTPRRRITGAERETLKRLLASDHARGVSVRALARALGRSQGFVRRLLAEAAVPPQRRRG